MKEKEISKYVIPSKKFGIKREIQLEILKNEDPLWAILWAIANTIICQRTSNIRKAIPFHLYT